jgi:pimeloyl-ACP methyl ester carboxylesterase
MYAYPHFRTVTDLSYDHFMKLDLNNMIMYFTIMPNVDIKEWLPDIRVPTLVIASDLDPIIPPAQALLIKNMIPHAELEMIKGG